MPPSRRSPSSRTASRSAAAGSARYAGVNVDGVIRTLLTRGLIEELDEAGEGGSILYGTTSYFLERMGLGSLDELPAIAPFLPEVDALDELAERGRG